MREIVFADNPGVRAVSLAVVPDFNGNGANELAVLARRKSGLGVIYVRDCLTERPVLKGVLDEGWAPLDLEVIPDLDGSASPALAVLSRKPNGKVRVFVFDLPGGAQVAGLKFPSRLAPLDLEVVPSFDGTGGPAVTLLAREETTAQVRVITRDVRTAAVVGDWSFGQGFLPIDLEIIPETARPGFTRAAVLGEKLNGAGRVFIRRLADGEKVGVARLGRKYSALDLEPVPHANASGSVGLAVLEVSKRHGLVRVSTRHALGGWRLGEARFADLSSVRGMAVVGDIGGSPADEIALLGESRCAEGGSGITLRDAGDGLLIQCFPVP